MTQFWIIGAVLLGIGLWWLIGGLRRLSGAPLRATSRLLIGAASGVAGVATLLVGLDLQTYQRLTHEQPVAELRFSQLAPQRFEAQLTRPGQLPERYELHGDQWQLDARVLKWQGPAVVAGLDARFKLDRLSGRFTDIGEETSRMRSVYSLAGDAPLDIWAVAHEHPGWLAWVDAGYGSATYLPMADQAEFSATLTQSGLVARPMNAAGEQAVRRWR